MKNFTLLIDLFKKNFKTSLFIKKNSLQLAIATHNWQLSLITGKWQFGILLATALFIIEFYFIPQNCLSSHVWNMVLQKHGGRWASFIRKVTKKVYEIVWKWFAIIGLLSEYLGFVLVILCSVTFNAVVPSFCKLVRPFYFLIFCFSVEV